MNTYFMTAKVTYQFNASDDKEAIEKSLYGEWLDYAIPIDYLEMDISDFCTENNISKDLITEKNQE
jgi:hypothetical protein